MNTYRRLYYIVSLICTILSSKTALAHSLMIGTIQFPHTVSAIPSVRIYCAGRIIPCTTDQRNKTISFTIPKYSQQELFNLLITEQVSFSFTESGNNASFLKLKDGQPYRLYALHQMPKFSSEPEKLTKEWRIRPASLPLENGKTIRVPDETIVVCLNPSWVAELDTSNSFELQLPSIKIKSNIVELAGSQEKLYESSARLILAALDSDTMHANQEPPAMKHLESRITIAAPTA